MDADGGPGTACATEVVSVELRVEPAAGAEPLDGFVAPVGIPGIDGVVTGGDATTPRPPGPSETCTECGAPGSTGMGPIAVGSVAPTLTPLVGEVESDTPSCGAPGGVATCAGPIGGTNLATGGGTLIGTEIGPSSSADAAPANRPETTKAAPADSSARRTIRATPVRRFLRTLKNFPSGRARQTESGQSTVSREVLHGA